MYLQNSFKILLLLTSRSDDEIQTLELKLLLYFYSGDRFQQIHHSLDVWHKSNKPEEVSICCKYNWKINNLYPNLVSIKKQ